MIYDVEMSDNMCVCVRRCIYVYVCVYLYIKKRYMYKTTVMIKIYNKKLSMDSHHTDDIVLLANTPAQAESLLHSLEQAAGGVGLHVNANKTEYMCFNQRGNISTLNGGSLKLVNNFTYLGSSISSTEKYGLLLIGYPSYGSQTYLIK